jgi:hypothetical protein
MPIACSAKPVARGPSNSEFNSLNSQDHLVTSDCHSEWSVQVIESYAQLFSLHCVPDGIDCIDIVSSLDAMALELGVNFFDFLYILVQLESTFNPLDFHLMSVI